MSKHLFFLCIMITSTLLFSNTTAAEEPVFTFVQLCDPQIQLEISGETAFRVEGTIERLKTAISQINALRPDFVVISGDHVQRSSDESFTAFNEIKEGLAVPCYSAPGNHDFNPARGDERATPERLDFYREHIGRDYFSIEHKGFAFVFINTPLYLAKSGDDISKVEPFEGRIKHEVDAQHSWLKTTLRKYKKDKTPVFVVCHHPIHPEMPALAPGVLSVALRQELFALFKETGVVAVLGGHGHRVFMQEYEDIAVVHAHTTSFILERDPEKRKQFGFRLWRVYQDGRFEHEFVSLDTSWNNESK